MADINVYHHVTDVVHEPIPNINVYFHTVDIVHDEVSGEGEEQVVVIPMIWECT